MLGENRYGKSGIRLVHVAREEDRHRLADLTVDVWLEGDFDATYTQGDNAEVLPTDTLRGTVYAFARERWSDAPEEFAVTLARHFVETVPAARRARVELSAASWDRVDAHAFTAGPGVRRTATVTHTAEHARVVSGVNGLSLLKTARSAFSGFRRDRYTTLVETDDRILATLAAFRWRWTSLDVDWSARWEGIRSLLLATFAAHDSRSVQHTLHAMGEAVLAAHPEIAELRCSMPNNHHVLVDLSSYGLDNPNEVFVATDRPSGVIDATVLRPGAAPDDDPW